MADAKARRTVVAEADLQRRVSALAAQISGDYAGQTLDVVCLTNGGGALCADLVRQLTIPSRLHLVAFSSYPQGNPTGEVRMTLDVTEPLNGRHVLVVEGVVVSGRTPKYVMDMLRLRKPASLEMCALGKKTKQIAVDLPIKYCAFELGDEMVMGYGVGSGTDKTLRALVEESK